MNEIWSAYKTLIVTRLKQPDAEERRRPGMKTQRGVVVVVIATIFGMILIAIGLARAAPDPVNGAAVGLTSFLVFLAATTVGAGLGFLFGLPRSRFADALAQGDGPSATQTSPSSKHYLNNSNLIKVSDWLTTIVVGLTLVNLDMVVPAINDLGATLSAPLGGQVYSPVVGVAITIFGILAGFILTFLWVSIRVRELMEDAEKWAEMEVVPRITGLTVREAITSAATFQLRLVLPQGVTVDQIVSDQDPPQGTLARKGSDLQIMV